MKPAGDRQWGGICSKEGWGTAQEISDDPEGWCGWDRKKLKRMECQGMRLGTNKRNLCCKLGADQQEITKEEKGLDVLSNWRMTVGLWCDTAWKGQIQS